MNSELKTDDNFVRSIDFPEELPESKDNRCKAIVAINIFGIAITVMGVLWKIAASEGFNVVEFTFFRCLSALIVSIIWNMILGLNPFKLFP